MKHWLNQIITFLLFHLALTVWYRAKTWSLLSAWMITGSEERDSLFCLLLFVFMDNIGSVFSLHC